MKSFKIGLLLFFISLQGLGQTIEKVTFDTKDTTDGYYLAIRPRSNDIKGVLLLMNSFSAPERMLPETKLYNVAYANDLLTVAFSMKQKLYADAPAIERLNSILSHVVSTYKTDTSKFVLAGYDFAGGIAIRYTELTVEQPSKFPIHPKAVIAIDSPVDLFALWKWSERQISRKSQDMGDAQIILDLMTKENGLASKEVEKYIQLSPSNLQQANRGNEQYLKDTPLRLYYDVDPEWQLKYKGYSLYDTYIPEGTELISRLLALGNSQAELITAKKPGMNSRGIRTPHSLSIVDEVECIHWIKNKLHIFDPNTWVAPYFLLSPNKWQVERFPIPIDFAPQISYKGVEEIRFAPGWADQKSEQYWSYAYLWWLEGEQKVNAAILESNLTAYYQGLVGRNITSSKIPSNKVVPIKVSIKPTKTQAEDIVSYTGSISMLDYMSSKPIVLNCLVHVKKCKSENTTAIFIELSPQSYTHPIWREMNRIYSSFSCSDSN